MLGSHDALEGGKKRSHLVARRVASILRQIGQLLASAERTRVLRSVGLATSKRVGDLPERSVRRGACRLLLRAEAGYGGGITEEQAERDGLRGQDRQQPHQREGSRCVCFPMSDNANPGPGAGCVINLLPGDHLDYGIMNRV